MAVNGGTLQVANQHRELNGDSAPELSSGDAWKGIRLEQRRLGRSEYFEATLVRHAVGLVLSGARLLEASWPGQARATWRLRPGSVNIVPAGIPLVARAAGGAKKIHLEIDPDFFSSVIRTDASGEYLQPRPAFGVEDLLISQLLVTLRDEARAGNPGGRLYAESLGTALVAHLVRRHAVRWQDLHRYRGGLPMNRLQFVTGYIDEHLETDLALLDLAKMVQMSVFHFIRAFKQSTGLPPHQYVLGKRIERAKSLLPDPKLSIAEVALRCGFGSQSSFTTAFRRSTNVTPGAYRNASL